MPDTPSNNGANLSWRPTTGAVVVLDGNALPKRARWRLALLCCNYRDAGIRSLLGRTDLLAALLYRAAIKGVKFLSLFTSFRTHGSKTVIASVKVTQVRRE